MRTDAGLCLVADRDEEHRCHLEDPHVGTPHRAMDARGRLIEWETSENLSQLVDPDEAAVIQTRGPGLPIAAGGPPTEPVGQDRALDALANIAAEERAARELRDAMLGVCQRAGCSVSAIARAAGLSRPGVTKIIARAEGTERGRASRRRRQVGD